MQSAAAIRDRALLDAAKYGQQYEDRAYDRWKDARDFTGDKLATAWDMMKGKYDLESGAEKADREAFNEQINNDWTRRFFEQQLESGNLDITKQRDDLITSLLNGELTRKYASGLAADEATISRIQAEIAETYGLSNAEAEYVARLLANDATKAGIEGQWISNDTARENYKWLAPLNYVSLAQAITNGEANGGSFPAAEFWKYFWNLYKEK